MPTASVGVTADSTASSTTTIAGFAPISVTVSGEPGPCSDSSAVANVARELAVDSGEIGVLGLYDVGGTAERRIFLTSSAVKGSGAGAAGELDSGAVGDSRALD